MRAIAIGCFTLALFASVASGQNSGPTPTPAAGTDRVFYFTHIERPQQMQEITNIVRAMNDTSATFDGGKRTMSVQGSPAQLAMAEWVLAQMDRTTAPPLNPPNVQHYRNDRGQDEIVRIYSLSHINTPQQLQELTNMVRSISDLQRVFPYNALNVLAIRGSAAQLDMAEWLIQQLDRPAGSPAPDAGTRDIPWALRGAESAKVFYLQHQQAPQAGMQILDQIRTATKLQRIYLYNGQHALSVRGSTDQLVAVDRMLRDLDRE